MRRYSRCSADWHTHRRRASQYLLRSLNDGEGNKCKDAKILMLPFYVSKLTFKLTGICKFLTKISPYTHRQFTNCQLSLYQLSLGLSYWNSNLRRLLHCRERYWCQFFLNTNVSQNSSVKPLTFGGPFNNQFIADLLLCCIWFKARVHYFFSSLSNVRKNIVVEHIASVVCFWCFCPVMWQDKKVDIQTNTRLFKSIGVNLINNIEGVIGGGWERGATRIGIR